MRISDFEFDPIFPKFLCQTKVTKIIASCSVGHLARWRKDDVTEPVLWPRSCVKKYGRQKEAEGNMQHQLGSTVGVLLCAVTILVVLSVIGSIVLIYKKRKRCRQDFLSSGRLRDRLDTTEFMNSLATIDRKLTLDEILEKRRKAMWSPDLRFHQNNDVIVALD